jgi:phosphonate transport system substrate-binding protein
MRKCVSALVLILLLSLIPITAFSAPKPELGTEENPIVWALVPSGETQAVLAGADEVVTMLEEKTGYVFEAVVATDYTGVIEALKSNPPSAHMAALNTFGAILASELGVAEVALIAVRRGDPFYGGQFIASKASGIKTLADMAGKTFAIPDPTSTSGWIVPQIVLAANGVNPDTDLAEVVNAGGHPAVVAAVYSGSADAGSTYVDARTAVQGDFPDVMEKVIVVEEFGPIPNDGIQFSTKMEPEMKAAIVKALLEISKSEAGAAALDSIYNWNELIEQTDEFYDPFRQVLEASGFDIQDFVK